jgi:hypothetical protein
MTHTLRKEALGSNASNEVLNAIMPPSAVAVSKIVGSHELRLVGRQRGMTVMTAIPTEPHATTPIWAHCTPTRNAGKCAGATCVIHKRSTTGMLIPSKRATAIENEMRTSDAIIAGHSSKYRWRRNDSQFGKHNQIATSQNAEKFSFAMRSIIPYFINF